MRGLTEIGRPARPASARTVAVVVDADATRCVRSDRSPDPTWTSLFGVTRPECGIANAQAPGKEGHSVRCPRRHTSRQRQLAGHMAVPLLTKVTASP